jgi:hypothetical protein
MTAGTSLLLERNAGFGVSHPKHFLSLSVFLFVELLFSFDFNDKCFSMFLSQSPQPCTHVGVHTCACVCVSTQIYRT